MRVYIANFGKSNWAWVECLSRPALAVMDDERVHPLWERGDRDGYIEVAQRVLHLASGSPVIRPVASRWYNLNSILMETAGDLWIHREKDTLWWTQSVEAVPQRYLIDDPQPHSGTGRIFVYYKPCLPWSNRTRRGTLLAWDALHPKAKEFLFTEGTFQQLSDDNSAYAQALVSGKDLSEWHRRTEWATRADKAKRSAVTIFDSRKKTLARMAETAWNTAARSGTTSVHVAKTKAFGFPDQYALERYLAEILTAQDGVCALTNIPMLLDDDDGDPELRCSLDRIDSDRHYERGNLQIVCRFANRWKGASENSAFLRLVDQVRRAGTVDAGVRQADTQAAEAAKA